jgi:uncharacterized protein (DUF58 family)
MLSPEIIKKIKKVHIKSGRLVNTLMAGQYKSVFRGAGIEFEEVREYSPGDEVKSIDWKVTARMGRPFIKLYREERELIVMLLVDMSASGRFGTTAAIKRDTAAEIASILAFNAIRNNDKVGAILFTDRVEKYIPPKKGTAHVWRVIKEIFTFEPAYTGTAIDQAVGFLGRVCRKKSVSFLISDFLHSDIDQNAASLKSVSRKHELIGILVSDPGEFSLPKGGLVLVEDLESRQRLVFDASHKATRKAYEKQQQQGYHRILEALKAMDIDCIEIATNGSSADALTRYFRYREKRKR